jgi:mercuric reductase
MVDRGEPGFAPLGTGKLPALELRPGTAFPHWPAVTSTASAEALKAIFSAFDLVQRWSGYSGEEDNVRRASIEGLAELDEGPDISWIAKRTRYDRTRVMVLLSRLTVRDLVVRNGDGTRIVGAYPLTTKATEHRVTIGGRTVQAMCAVDALGTGAMFGADAVIESRCRACGVPIRIATRNRGTSLDQVEPASAVVWSGIHYEGACAATSLCTVIAFFCDRPHAEEWREANHVAGFLLTPEEAKQVGVALFAPVLASPGAADCWETEIGFDRHKKGS